MIYPKIISYPDGSEKKFSRERRELAKQICLVSRGEKKHSFRMTIPTKEIRDLASLVDALTHLGNIHLRGAQPRIYSSDKGTTFTYAMGIPFTQVDSFLQALNEEAIKPYTKINLQNFRDKTRNEYTSKVDIKTIDAYQEYLLSLGSKDHCTKDEI